MLASTSSALAPDQVTVTVIAGTSTVGKNWVLSRIRPKIPNRIIIAISRLWALR